MMGQNKHRKAMKAFTFTTIKIFSKHSNHSSKFVV